LIRGISERQRDDDCHQACRGKEDSASVNTARPISAAPFHFVRHLPVSDFGRVEIDDGKHVSVLYLTFSEVV